MKRALVNALLSLLLISILSTPIAAQGGEPTSIDITPIADVNPVKTQHTFIVTVYDGEGNPLPNQRVEWILARGPGAVGDIVEHDDKDGIAGSREVVKISNQYSVSYTNEGPSTPLHGLPVGVGQTWCTITSPLEGETHVIAFCPAIQNASKHKVFAVKYWIDAKISWPEDAVNRIGEPHLFNFNLTKASSNTPLTDYRVRWKLMDGGPEGALGEGEKEVETTTNESGDASVTLSQVDETPGVNTVEIKLISPKGKLLATRTVTKTWISPSIQVQKTCPEEGILGENVLYNIVVSNGGQAEARDVVLKDVLPDGMSYVSASEKPAKVQGKNVSWNLGTMKSGDTRNLTMTLKAMKVGTWTNKVQVFSDRGDGPTSEAIVRIGSPDIYIIKEGPPEIRLGNIATYTLTIKNKGNRRARNVVIQDNIPQGMSYKGKETGFSLKWPAIPELAPGEERKIAYRLQTVRTGSFENEALVIVGDKTVHKDTFVTKVVAPGIEVTKEVNQRLIFLHKNAEFEITVTNKGTGTAFDVNVLDTIPKELDYISSSPQGIYQPSAGDQLASIRWKLGDLAPDKKVTLKLSLRGKLIGTCTNTVKVTSEGKVYDAAAEVRIKGVSAMHLQSYDTDDPVEVGKRTIYFIEARNEGTSACTNVKMVNEIPEEMKFISATGPSEYKADKETGIITFKPVAILQPGEKLVYKIVCEVVSEGTAKGSAKNRATLTYDQFEKPIIDEEGTSVYK